MTTCTNINNMKQDLKKIIDKKPFDKNELMIFLNKYKIKYDNTFKQNIENTCENIAINTGHNNIDSGNEKCRKAINDTCKELFPKNEQKFKECKKTMRPKIKNVTQSNVSEIDNSCYVSSITKDLQKDNDYKFAIALNSSIANSPDFDCTKISSVGSFDSYFMNLNKCINDSTSNLQNYISACGNVSDIVQKNINKIISDCSIINEVKSGQSEEKKQEQQSNKPDILQPINPDTSPTIDNKNKNNKILYWIIGGSIGSLVLITLIITIILIVKKKK